MRPTEAYKEYIKKCLEAGATFEEFKSGLSAFEPDFKEILQYEYLKAIEDAEVAHAIAAGAITLGPPSTDEFWPAYPIPLGATTPGVITYDLSKYRNEDK